MSRTEIDSVRFDGKTVVVRGFQKLEDCRHVFKHVLDPTQQWGGYLSFAGDLGVLRRRLTALGCKGEQHGTLCTNFARCDEELKKLCPSYQNLILEAIREGAFERNPRHTHQVRGRLRTNYFLSEKGMLAETYEKKDALLLRTAYRHVTGPRRRRSDLDFVRAAKRKICNMPDVVRHTEDRWCGDITRSLR
jgi:hypothetical protein